MLTNTVSAAGPLTIGQVFPVWLRSLAVVCLRVVSPVVRDFSFDLIDLFALRREKHSSTFAIVTADGL